VFGFALAAYVIDHDDVVWVISPWHTPRQQLLARCIFASAAVLLGLAEAGRTWARAYEGPNGAYKFDSQLAGWSADGPFRHVRHPLFLSDVMFVLGIGSLFSRTGLLIAIVGIGLIHIWAVKRCEHQLQQAGKQTHRELFTGVPRLVPSLHARIPARGSVPQWRRAFRAEASGWSCCLMLVAFSITLRDSVAWTIGGLALALAVILNVSNFIQLLRDRSPVADGETSPQLANNGPPQGTER